MPEWFGQRSEVHVEFQKEPQDPNAGPDVYVFSSKLEKDAGRVLGFRV